MPLEQEDSSLRESLLAGERFSEERASARHTMERSWSPLLVFSIAMNIVALLYIMTSSLFNRGLTSSELAYCGNLPNYRIPGVKIADNLLSSSFDKCPKPRASLIQQHLRCRVSNGFLWRAISRDRRCLGCSSTEYYFDKLSQQGLDSTKQLADTSSQTTTCGSLPVRSKNSSRRTPGLLGLWSCATTHSLARSSCIIMLTAS